MFFRVSCQVCETLYSRPISLGQIGLSFTKARISEGVWKKKKGIWSKC